MDEEFKILSSLGITKKPERGLGMLNKK